MSERTAPESVAAERRPFDFENEWQAVLDRRRLSFLDIETERSFRAAERSRNLRQARFGLAIAAGLNLVFGLFDPIVYQENVLFIMLIRLGAMTLLLGVLIGLTFTEFYRTRWPGLLMLAELVFAVGYGLTNVLGAPPPAVASGFIMVVLGSYLLLPLIFQIGSVSAWVMTAVFVGISSLHEGLHGNGLVVLTLQLVGANIIGMLALYRSERFRRLDFLRNLQVAAERARYRELLTSILPERIADRLERGETVVDEFAEAAVLFCDIVGFTEMASKWPASTVLGLLNQVFARFDELVERHGLEKVKTIGDSYMVAGGVPLQRDGYLEDMAALALEMRAVAASFTDPGGNPLRVRIGIHVGSLVAGVIGDKRFLYDLWGDTVNTASRMESLGKTGEIQVSGSVQSALAGCYAFEPRGQIEVKGKGTMETWFLVGRLNASPAAAVPQE